MPFARFVPFLLLAAAPAAADPITLRFDNGLVTMKVQNVPVRQVLAEWARLGQTRVVNGEKVPGPAVTLELVNVPEKQALEVLLRAASGYMAAPRATALAANLSSFDRIVVMPTSSAAPPPPAAGLRALPPQPQGPMGQPQGDPNAFQGSMPVQVDDQDEPVSPQFPVNDGSGDPNAQQPGAQFGPGPVQPDAQGRPVGNQGGEPNGTNATPPEPPPPPGPTPVAPGMLTTPLPGQTQAPQPKPPQ